MSYWIKTWQIDFLIQSNKREVVGSAFSICVLLLFSIKKAPFFIYFCLYYSIIICKKNEIDTLVVGKNKEWEQNASMSKGSNQKFVDIPYQMLLQQLKYKCENAMLYI